MLDIKWIRENAAALDAALARRDAAATSAEIIRIDEERRDRVQKLQDMQSRRNSASKEIGAAMGRKDQETADRLKAEVAELKSALQTAEEDVRALDLRLEEALSAIPNIPLDDVPEGADEEDNVEVRKVGTKPGWNYKPLEHFEIGEALDQMDFELASRIAGSRFVVLRGQLARLERALGQFMLDLHTSEHGYTEVDPPLLVRDEAMFGTAQLPKFEDDQ